MAQSILAFTNLVVLISSLLVLLFTATRVWRSRSLKSLLLLSIDFIVVSILPITIINWVSSGLGAIERLLLVGLLFYLTNCVCCLLFPSRFERYLLPIASVYLVVGTLVSFPVLQIGNDFEFQLSMFVYRLMDNVTVATLSELFITDLVPVYNYIGFRLNESLGRHFFNMAKRNSSVTAPDDPALFNSRVKESKLHNSLPSPTKTPLSLFRERKYKLCVESCDATIENLMVTTMLQLHPARLESPLTIEEQISRLESKGLSIPGKKIMELRSLRNGLTAACSEGTSDQARWAIRVMRRTIKTIKEFRKAMPSL